MSDSVRAHRWKPIRLLRPWDSPGKNTGVGWHFLLQCMKVKSESEVAQSCPTPLDSMDCSLPGSSVHGIFQARVLEWVATAFSKSARLPSCIFWIYNYTTAWFQCPHFRRQNNPLFTSYFIIKVTRYVYWFTNFLGELNLIKISI